MPYLKIQGFITQNQKNPRTWAKAPPWIRLLITSRPDSEVMHPLQHLTPYLLDTASPENEEDIREYLARELKPYCCGKSAQEKAMHTILERSEGVFLYVKWVCDELSLGRLSIDQLDAFPQGLGGMYGRFFERQFHDLEAFKTHIRTVMEAIIAAREPLELKTIASIFNWDDYEMREFLGSVGALFTIVAQRIQPFHKSLREWLIDPMKAGQFFISERKGHERLVEFGWRQYRVGVENLSRYFLEHLPAHLRKTEDWDKLEQVLLDIGYIEARCAEGMTYELIRDYRETIDALPESREAKSDRLERESRIKGYTEELIDVCKRGRHFNYIISATEPWSEERIRERFEFRRRNLTRRDKIEAFFHFVNSQNHGLVKFAEHPGFVVQQGHNSFGTGPVAEAVEHVIRADAENVLLLHSSLHRAEYDPCPALLRTLEGHRNNISVRITPDGKKAFSGSWDKTLRVWDLETGECLLKLKTFPIESLSVTPDGKIAISGSKDKNVWVWDIEKRKCLLKLEGHSSSVSAVSIAPDGTQAISGSHDETLRLWNLETGKSLKILTGHKWAISSVSIMSDGKRALSGSWDRTLRLWDLDTGKCLRTLSGHKWRISSVSLSADGKRALSGSWDRTLRLWDLESGECLKILEGHSDMVNGVSMTSDGKLALSGSDDKTLRLWDLDNGVCLRTIEEKNNSVYCVDLTADGMLAVSGSGGGGVRGTDYTIHVWNPIRGRTSKGPERHTGRVGNISVTLDGRFGVSASWDKALRVWDCETGECYHRLEGHSYRVVSLDVVPGGRLAISGSGDKTLRVWDLEIGKCLNELKGHTGLVERVKITTDGTRIVSGSHDRTLRFWDLKSGTCLKSFEGHTSRVNSIALSPDGRQALSGSWDNTLRLWDIERGVCLSVFRGHVNTITDMKITPDGKRALSGSEDKTVCLWDLGSGEHLKTLEGHKAELSCIFIAPDGKRAVSGGWDNVLRVWDIPKTRCIHILEGHLDWISCAIITPDGKKAISGSEDRTIRVWDLESGKTLAAYQARSQVVSLSNLSPSGHFAYGTAAGEVIFLKLFNLEFSVITTPVRIWFYGKKGKKGHWAHHISAICCWCGRHFRVGKEIRKAIKSINSEANLAPNQSPCLELPDEARDEPRLQSECPLCHKHLKFNPFIVDNRDRC